MKRVPVESSSVKSVGYNEDKNILEIEFVKGTVYQYFDVPALLHSQLLKAESHGTFLDTRIKKGGFRYERVV
jgi:KTSC domain